MPSEAPPKRLEIQAYLSSALTIRSELEKKYTLGLNLDVKSWIEGMSDDRCRFTVYLPQLASMPGLSQHLSPQEVYILDRWRVSESDVVIANLDLPAVGIGQEVMVANSLGIPIIPFHHDRVTVTRIVRGIPSIFLLPGEEELRKGVIVYSLDDPDSLRPLLETRVRALYEHVAQARKQDASTEGRQSFSSQLRAYMEQKSMDVHEVSHKTKLSVAFIEELRQDYKSVHGLLSEKGVLEDIPLRDLSDDRYTNPGIWVLARLREAIGFEFEQRQ